MFENPGSKTQHKKIKTVSAATENISILLIHNYQGKPSLHFYHRAHTKIYEENWDWVTLLNRRMRERHWLVSNTRFRAGWAPPPASGAGGRVCLAGFGSSEETHSLGLILHSENRADLVCPVATVCHRSESLWQQGQRQGQRTSLLLRSSLEP